MTAETVAEYDVVLCVGDTTFLDYGSIVSKKEGYGPIGKGGNGLILHSALAIEPEKGQSLGLLWQKLWNREPKQKPPKDETFSWFFECDCCRTIAIGLSTSYPANCRRY
jgi:hypothetical protein